MDSLFFLYVSIAAFILCVRGRLLGVLNKQRVLRKTVTRIDRAAAPIKNSDRETASVKLQFSVNRGY